jgi:hypothetical protein
VLRAGSTFISATLYPWYWHGVWWAGGTKKYMCGVKKIHYGRDLGKGPGLEKKKARAEELQK